jgi:hypothetical protein
MSNERLVIVAVGVLLVTGGLFALRFPVFLGEATREESTTGLPMFKAEFPSSTPR